MFYSTQCCTFSLSLSFSSIFFFFLSKFMAFSGQGHKKRISWNFQSVSTSTIDVFPSYRDVQSSMGQGQEHEYNLGHILWHMPKHHVFTIRIDANHSNSSLVHFVGWLFPAFQTLPNIHVDMVSGVQPLGGGGGGRRSHAPPPSISICEPNKVQQFPFQTSGILLLTGVQKFHYFYHVRYNFWIIYSGFSFFLTTQGKQITSSWIS